MSSERPERPVLRVVNGGEPTAGEIAALVTALAVVTRPPTSGRAPVSSVWAERATALREPVRVGPGAWRRSGRTPGTRTRAGW